MVQEETKVHILHIVRDCLRLVEITPYHFSYLAQMFNTLQKRGMRIALCEVCVSACSMYIDGFFVLKEKSSK